MAQVEPHDVDAGTDHRLERRRAHRWPARAWPRSSYGASSLLIYRSMELLLIRHALPVRVTVVDGPPIPGSRRRAGARPALLAEYLATEPDRRPCTRSPLRRAVRDRGAARPTVGLCPWRRSSTGSPSGITTPPSTSRSRSCKAAERPAVGGDARAASGSPTRTRPRTSRHVSCDAIESDHRRPSRGQMVAVVCHGGVINALPRRTCSASTGHAEGSSTPTTRRSTGSQLAPASVGRDGQRDAHLRGTGLPIGLFQKWLSRDHPTRPIDDLRAYLDASPSPWHAVTRRPTRLQAAGFDARSTSERLGRRARRGLRRRGGAIDRVALTGRRSRPTRRSASSARTPTRRACASSRIPTASRAGWRQLGVEVYGGILNNSWLDRDLGIAGRVVLADGTDDARRRATSRSPASRSSPSTSIATSTTRPRARPPVPPQPVWGVGRRDAGEFAAVARRRGRHGEPRVVGAVPVRRRSRPRCSAPTARCWPAGGSTTSCRAGRRRPRWSTRRPADHRSR